MDLGGGEYVGGRENGGGYRLLVDPERPRIHPIPCRPHRPICLELYETPIVAHYPGHRALDYSALRLSDPYGYHAYFGHPLELDGHPYPYRYTYGHSRVVDVYGHHHRYARIGYLEYPMRCYCEASTRPQYVPPGPAAPHHAHAHPWAHAYNSHAAAAPAQPRHLHFDAGRVEPGGAIPNSAFRRYNPAGYYPPPNIAREPSKPLPTRQRFRAPAEDAPAPRRAE